MSDLARRVFELSQVLSQKWLTADYATKRRIVEIVFLNCQLNDGILIPKTRRPFDVLAEGPLSEKRRGDRI
jgi:site-specific DNA recombinase